jgi:hypothetical protein
VSNVLVFEGQTLSWTLNLTNISAQTITGCKVGPVSAWVLLHYRGELHTCTAAHSFSRICNTHHLC